MRDYAPLEAMIVGDEIVIRLPIQNIPMALKIAQDMQTIGAECRITDAKLFAADIVRALNDEDEEGTTPLMEVFDQAMEKAICDGAEGIECDE